MIARTNGEFTAAESWKCPRCRRAHPPGSRVVIYVDPGRPRGPHHFCVPCAGVFRDLATAPVAPRDETC